MGDYEQNRLFTLRQLNLLDTPPQASFDRIVRTASRLFEVPIAAVSLVDEDRLWLKARVGIEARELPRYKACCSQIVYHSEAVVAPDLLADPEYADGYLAANGLRFYAGVPLTTRDGYTLGSLCVLDAEPREVSPQELASLRDLAGLVMSQIELQQAVGRVDAITGLANYNQLVDDLSDAALDDYSGPRYLVHLAGVDADEASSIQRGMGPAYLDGLAREAAHALTSALGDDDAVYHLGNCQFVHIFCGISDDALARARDLTDEVRAVTVDGAAPLMLHPVAGVAPSEPGDDRPHDVLRMAQSAVRDARLAASPASLYSPAADAVHRRSFSLLGRFREALAGTDALHLAYQPRVDPGTGQAVGVETLLRWQDPVLGEVSPAEFVPLVERTPIARELTDWVLAHAIAQTADWWRRGLALRVSVNIAPCNLEEPDLADRVLAYLADAELGASALELELTESSLVGSGPTAREQLRQLIDAGITVAIDDFGTGYSSLTYLQDLPARVIKIDRAFLERVDEGAGRQVLLRSMVTMAGELGYRVVSEGVDTPAAWRCVSALGCHEAQGNYLSEPLSAVDLEAWLRDPNQTGGPAVTAQG